MEKKYLIIVSISLLTLNNLKGQSGGDNVYEFLNLTHSGLVASLGGTNVSHNSGSINLVFHNPALLNSSNSRSLVLNYVNYFAGINYGMAMYGQSLAGAGNFAAAVTYLNYGSFTGADASGNITGAFTASEYSFPLTYSRPLDSLFSIGITFKPVLSFLEKYSSVGLAFDLGASYNSPSGLFSAGLAIRNAGLQITSYAGEERQKLPFEIEAGITQKLEHAPLRFSVTARHLQIFDLTYSYNDTTALKTDTFQSSEFLENLMRHFVFGAELIPHRNFWLSAGYNYQRRRELQTEARIAAVGFSWGFGINTTLLDIEFGRATYHLAGSSNHVSFIVRTDRLYNRLKK
jgi:hypothetical protein